MDWRFVGPIDMGPNPENSAQRVVLGSPGEWVRVTVCIPPGKKTPDGCVIRARNGNGCDSREFQLPGGGN